MRSFPKDLVSKEVLASQTVTGPVQSTSIDLKFYLSAVFMVTVGAFAFSTTNRLDLVIEESDDNATWNEVPGDAVYQSKFGAGAIAVAKSLNGTADQSKTHMVPVYALKRYARLSVKEVGTVSVTMSALALQADARNYDAPEPTYT